ncbi:MAG: xanthine dehydrogenase family protein molybdopterin-binding subunit [Oleibacter sp.]|nr:xanthine dehydrogenase family protein molybdopterin-binding subunit [Thalassolituus sp.]
MTSSSSVNTSRRRFLGGSCLVVGFTLTPKGLAQAYDASNNASKSAAKTLNAFVIVAPDDTVTVLSKHIEFGQGPYTGLATLVAEEMDADWAQIRVDSAPADNELYANTMFGAQLTGGSTTMANSYTQMREAGATARTMLLAAAAIEWSVPASELTVEKGRIRHAKSGKESGFGAFAADAAKLTPPEKVTLKNSSDFVLIGENRPKVDTKVKTNGEAKFTLDLQLDNMLIATVLHPSHYGATVSSLDAKAALAIPGVVDVKAVPSGVAVYAENTYAALKGRQALNVKWNESAAETRSSEQIIDSYRAMIGKKGITATERGDISKAFSNDTSTTHEAEFVFPFLAHAPMEPLDAVLMRQRDGSIDCYAGSQFPTGDKQAISEVCQIDAGKVRIHTQLAGGSFGRRAQFNSPFMREASEVFKASGMSRPVKLFWTREDDIRGGFYRPIYVHQLKGAINADGTIDGWDQVVVGQSIRGKTDEVDETSVEGASDLPYVIENMRMVSHNTTNGVPPLWWRSVGHTHTAFTVEVFLDELLEKSGKDPIEGRLALLKNNPRESAVLRRVAQMASSAGKPAKGRVHGVAVHKSFSSYVAQIAEVSVQADGTPKVHKVWVAVDCGVAVNPNIIKAQMEGGVGYGLGAILYDEITLGEGGYIKQSNFHDYRSLRIGEMPEVIVEIIESNESPTGVGEPGVPPIGPAVANAWRRLTGKPVRRLPLVRSQLS